MKEKIINFTFCLFCFIAIFFIFKNNNVVAGVIINAVNLFLNKVFVSLFPMFIINDILVNAGLPFYFYKLFNPLFKKLFHTSGIASYVFIMSLISGTPSQAYILKNLVANNNINETEASHYLYFTYFSNPLFLTLILSSMFPINSVVKIILIHYISNIIIGVLLRKHAPLIRENQINHNISLNIGNVLIKSISKAINTLLMILGTIVFYMLLSFLIVQIIPTSDFLKVLISGFLEITNGLNLLNTITITSKLKEIIAISIISFGGISIHTQIKAILEDTSISYSSFLKGRIMQSLISAVLVLLF
jgi:sporulation integral membrane protein YlbJ